MDSYWFQYGAIPANQIIGHYNYILVFLSYVIAVLASYVALDLAMRLRAEPNKNIQIYWLLGGSFAMGAGIWSMHFIGMLAFIMPMPMNYALSWTILSMLAAIIASALALYLLKNKNRPLLYMIGGGILIGLGIATMHYMGMYGMTNHVTIRYLPTLFFLSILIAILASEAALWLALRGMVVSSRQQFNYKFLSALVMGAAICGMHYTGMAAAIFTPLTVMHHDTDFSVINPALLAFGIAIITTLILGLALTVSIYKQRLTSVLHNEKKFLDTLINNLNDGIIACDAQGRLTVCNRLVTQYVNIPKHSSYQDITKYLIFKDVKLERSVSLENFPLHRALRGEHILDEEYVMQFGNNVRHVILDALPITNTDGEQIGAVLVIHDVTHMRETEKLKQEFVSIVSHELRTPLTSIRGSLSLLLANVAGQLPDRMKSLLQIANNNTERLIRLINDILDVEKIEAGKMEFKCKNVSITDIIQTAIQDVTPLAERNEVGIHFDYVGDELVYADFDKLVQVMVNLLSNAIRFSAPGQTVTVKVLPSATMTRVSVIDQGPGIPQDFRKRIFQKFSQAGNVNARKTGGTGLGLSISKAIVEKHGGTINFESIPNQLTSFYFDLPKVDEKIKAPQKIEDSKSQAHLLICDSNPDSAELLQRFLEKHGILSDIALSAQKAKEFITKHNYQVIAMDLVLQDYDGIKFIRELRQDPQTLHIPIIVMSTQVSEGKKELNGSAFQIIDWLQKPLQSQQLDLLLKYIRHEFRTDLPQILCVEDDPDISKIIQELLLDEAKVTNTLTLQDARQKIQTQPFDLIVLDIRLPDGLGTDLLPAVNYKTKKIIPVVVFSAYELDSKYAHLVKQSLLKSRISNQQLLSVLKSVLQETHVSTK